ncbi:hypothetical protein AB4Z50_03745 [Paenibacillus sp. 2TAB26]
MGQSLDSCPPQEMKRDAMTGAPPFGTKIRQSLCSVRSLLDDKPPRQTVKHTSHTALKTVIMSIRHRLALIRGFPVFLSVFYRKHQTIFNKCSLSRNELIILFGATANWNLL